MDSISIPIETGDDFLTTLARSLSRNKVSALMQFSYNSWDNDAEHVEVTWQYGKGYVMIDDDGDGMNEQTIPSFYRVAASEKIDNPVSLKGRTRLGQWGLATKLLEYLCEQYVLETWQDGQKITIRHRFAEDVQNSVVGEVGPDSEKEQGTRITLQGLKFTLSEVNSNSLRSALMAHSPQAADFSVTLNGRSIGLEERLYQQSQYLVDIRISEEIAARGIIYHNDKGQRDVHGVYLRSKGIGVGEPLLFDDLLEGPIDRKLLGFLDTTGIEHLLNFDMSQLSTHPQLTRLKEELLVIVESIAHEGGSLNSDTVRNKDRAKHYLGRARRIAEEMLKPLDVEHGTGNYKLKFFSQAPPTTAYVEGNTIHLNANSPFFRYALVGDIGRMGPLFAYHALEALSMQSSTEKVRKSMDQSTWLAASKIGGIGIGQLLDQPDDYVIRPIKELNLHPHQLHDVSTLSRITGHPVNSIHRMIRAEHLSEDYRNTHRGSYFLRASIEDALGAVDGFVPVGWLIDRVEFEKGAGISKPEFLKPYEYALADADDRPRYLLDIGRNGKHFWWVPRGREEAFRTYWRDR